jgi:hypothetical protein
LSDEVNLRTDSTDNTDDTADTSDVCQTISDIELGVGIIRPNNQCIDRLNVTKEEKRKQHENGLKTDESL